MKKSGYQVLPILALIVSTIGMGSAIFFVKLSEVDATSTLMLRMFIAGGIAGILRLGSTHASPPPASIHRRPATLLVLLFLSALASTIDLLSNHWALTFTSMANTAILMNLSPVFVALLSYIFLKEKLTARQSLSLLIALAGATVLVLAKNGGLSFSKHSFLGDLLALNSALFYAIYFMLLKELRGSINSRNIIIWQSLICGSLLLPIALLSSTPLFPTSPKGWLTIFALAIFSQLLGHGLMAYALKYVDVVLASISTLAKPVVAIMLGYVFFNEKLLPLQWLGVLTVLFGIAWYRRSPPAT
ncbi:EamA family transporter [Alcaligenes faecalis]|uniref:DMT family transporter n=1 Tax=Alcaligenes faecalis TaxID=511 RepID=UPI00129415E6|nr:EamA family transporter [Alcaligenes faecalis]QFY77463.1 EamA family transporter [Alcaligenes faecalis]